MAASKQGAVFELRSGFSWFKHLRMSEFSLFSRQRKAMLHIWNCLGNAEKHVRCWQ